MINLKIIFSGLMFSALTLYRGSNAGLCLAFKIVGAYGLDGSKPANHKSFRALVHYCDVSLKDGTFDQIELEDDILWQFVSPKEHYAAYDVTCMIVDRYRLRLMKDVPFLSRIQLRERVNDWLFSELRDTSSREYQALSTLCNILPSLNDHPLTDCVMRQYHADGSYKAVIGSEKWLKYRRKVDHALKEGRLKPLQSCRADARRT